uniref:Putative secreted protein n=1 Tax=Anopheles darlingi TaxID=43151 RepID=A0A2M4DG59_ANODA
MVGFFVILLACKSVAGVWWSLTLSIVMLCETIESVSAFGSLFCVIRCSLMFDLCCEAASLASRVVHSIEAGIATGLESLRNLPSCSVSAGMVSSLSFRFCCGTTL